MNPKHSFFKHASSKHATRVLSLRSLALRSLALRSLAVLPLVALALMFLAPQATLHAQVAVIAHKAVAVGTLDAPTLNNMYSLFKKDIGGAKLALFDLKTDSPVKEKFYTFIGKPSAEMKKIWMRSQLTGGGNPPANVATEDEMIEKVASTPGAIGYISQDKVSDKVKVLATIK
jgi:hypothetical protein